MESAWNGIQDIPVIVPILLSEDGIAEEVSRRLLLFNRGGVDLVFWLWLADLIQQKINEKLLLTSYQTKSYCY